jgi:hypothetical protein
VIQLTTDFGLTRVAECDYSSDPIETALGKQAIGFERRELPHIIGMGGNAWLLSYTSPKTGLPVTVLAVPHRYDVDDFTEEYFYFEGMAWSAALAGDVDLEWAERYDRCKKALASWPPDDETEETADALPHDIFPIAGETDEGPDGSSVYRDPQR